MTDYVGDMKEKIGAAEYAFEGAPKEHGILKRQLKSRHVAMIRFAQVVTRALKDV